MPNTRWMETEFMGNTFAIWLSALGVLVGGLLIVLLGQRFVLQPLLRRYAKRRGAIAATKAVEELQSAQGSDSELVQNTMEATRTDVVQSVSAAAKRFEKQLRFLLVSLVLFAAIGIPEWGDNVAPVLQGLATVLLVLASVLFLLGIYQFVMARFMVSRQEDAGRLQALRTVNFLVRLLVWIIAVVLVLDNFGVNITTLLAGLGIGGIAIALAAQTLLGDLFSGLVIFFDRPFELGDFISVGDLSGSVEHIGVKTTRIRSIGGEQLVLPNTDLTSSRIRNFKRLQRRRVSFRIGVAYETPTKALREIPGWIEQIVCAEKNATFDRAHFTSYSESSLQYEIVFFIESSDYLVYMDTLQAVNLAIKERFEEEGILFAYPTRTVYMKPQEP